MHYHKPSNRQLLMTSPAHDVIVAATFYCTDLLLIYFIMISQLEGTYVQGITWISFETKVSTSNLLGTRDVYESKFVLVRTACNVQPTKKTPELGRSLHYYCTCTSSSPTKRNLSCIVGIILFLPLLLPLRTSATLLVSVMTKNSMSLLRLVLVKAARQICDLLLENENHVLNQLCFLLKLGYTC